MEGNQMKMREALMVVRDALTTISAHEHDVEFVRTWIALTKKEVEQALALPLRQCDVGTAEEQDDRFFEFCCNKGQCKECEIYKRDDRRICRLRWAQMPYEEGGAE